MLFSSLKIKSIEIKNRIWVSPMCQYSSENGHPTDWHFVHLGSRAVGGAGLVMVEATAVSPEGRISPQDSGIWSDDHIPGFKRINDFMKQSGAACAIQLAHAGRKASTAEPWAGQGAVSPEQGGWETLAPSAIPFQDNYTSPREMTETDLKKAIADFAKATERSLKAGFDVVEIHMAHGYLLHEFLSPVSNHRRDQFGGSLENRMRFPLEVAAAVRSRWPIEKPVFVRISATDWIGAKGWDLPDAIVFCQKLKALGIDLIDCSSGGNLAQVNIPIAPGYQVPFAEKIRRETGMLTSAVGLITTPEQADQILREGRADAIMMGREFLRDPYFPLRAAKSLGLAVEKQKQYLRS